MPLEGQTAVTNPADWTSSLTYKSTVTSRPTIADLRELAFKARSKNHSLSVTGMLLYDKGRFFQTLEGPAASLAALWTSISRDKRHTNIEIISEQIIPARLFGKWDLLTYHGDAETDAAMRQAKAEHELSVKLPELLRLALNADDLGINALIGNLAEQSFDGEAILQHLIEPTARALGNAWLSDDCTELDLTIGLSMLQIAGHAVRHNPPSALCNRGHYNILLASAPGEPHTLGTSLLADLFVDAGWHVDMAFPDSNQALVNQLASQKPDALDIGLSEALPRQASLTKLAATIERSRFAAPDQLTVISVGGRLFADASASAQSVGADLARETAAGSTIRIAELIRQKRQLPRR